jgi:hypothetical protein
MHYEYEKLTIIAFISFIMLFCLIGIVVGIVILAGQSSIHDIKIGLFLLILFLGLFTTLLILLVRQIRKTFYQ